MKINSRVYPRSSKENVEYLEDQRLLKIRTKAAPVDGKANKEVINLVADFLGVNKKFVQISTGNASKDKIIEILDENITIDDFIKMPRLF